MPTVVIGSWGRKQLPLTQCALLPQGDPSGWGGPQVRLLKQTRPLVTLQAVAGVGVQDWPCSPAAVQTCGATLGQYVPGVHCGCELLFVQVWPSLRNGTQVPRALQVMQQVSLCEVQ